jgi:hypothetical protein
MWPSSLRRPASEPKKPRISATQRSRKYHSSATAVPRCSATRNGSNWGACLSMCMPNSAGTSSVWPRLLTGKSSVTPCSTLRNSRNQRLTRRSSKWVKGSRTEAMPARRSAPIMPGLPGSAKLRGQIVGKFTAPQQFCGLTHGAKPCYGVGEESRDRVPSRLRRRAMSRRKKERRCYVCALARHFVEKVGAAADEQPEQRGTHSHGDIHGNLLHQSVRHRTM